MGTLISAPIHASTPQTSTPQKMTLNTAQSPDVSKHTPGDIADGEKIRNIPNTITLFRFLATFVITYLILANHPPKTIFIFFVVAALTDKLDGTWARTFNRVTNFGAKFDIIADRAFFTATALCLLINNLFINPSGQVFVFSLFVIMTREMITLPAVLMKGFKIPEAKPVGKVTTFLQGLTLCMIILQWDITIYFAILTGIVGIFAGKTYFNDIVEGRWLR